MRPTTMGKEARTDGSHFDTVVNVLGTRRLSRGQTLRGLAVGTLAALTGLHLVAAEVGAKGHHHHKGKGKKKRPRPPRPPHPLGGCSPATSIQGSCPAGQICISRFEQSSICVDGCTATTNLAQGSCPAGQVCALTNNIEFLGPTGQCQTGPVCTPACQPTEVCCPADTAQAGQCRSDRQACDEVPIPA
jgi:hypothetical protein